MHIRYDVTAADWAALADFQLAHSPALQRTMRRTYWVAAGTVIVLAGTVALFTRSTLFTIVALMAGVVAALGIPRSVRAQMRKQMHAMFAETFPPGARTTMRLEPTNDGLATESPQGTGVTAWSAITVFTESADYLYLGLGGATGSVVPRGDRSRVTSRLSRPSFGGTCGRDGGVTGPGSARQETFFTSSAPASR